MTPESNLLQFYERELQKRNVVPKRNGGALPHCAWMIDEILHGWKETEDSNKVNRWIGFVQGVFWKEGLYSIDDMRNHVIGAKAATIVQS